MAKKKLQLSTSLSPRNYKGQIEFPEEGLEMSLKVFTELYGDQHVFTNLKAGDRDEAIKEAHNIATSKPKNGNATDAVKAGASSN